MRRFILRQNIRSFLAQLASATQTEQQQYLERMVNEARQELAGLEQLWRISFPDLNIGSNVGDDCELLLDHIVQVAQADYGSLQLWDGKRRCLALIAQTNFDGDLVKRFSEVREGDGSVCAEALRLRTRVTLGDVEDDIEFSGIHAWARKAGIRTIVSRSVLDEGGQCSGVFSLHYRHPQEGSQSEQLLLDAYTTRFRDLFTMMIGG